MKITFRKKIENVSLQVGDTAYFVTPNGNFANSSPKLIGKIDKTNDIKYESFDEFKKNRGIEDE